MGSCTEIKKPIILCLHTGKKNFGLWTALTSWKHKAPLTNAQRHFEIATIKIKLSIHFSYNIIMHPPCSSYGQYISKGCSNLLKTSRLFLVFSHFIFSVESESPFSSPILYFYYMFTPFFSSSTLFLQPDFMLLFLSHFSQIGPFSG